MLPKELIKKIRRIEISTMAVALVMIFFVGTTCQSEPVIARPGLTTLVEWAEIKASSAEWYKVHECEITNDTLCKEARLFWLIQPVDYRLNGLENKVDIAVEVFSVPDLAAPYFRVEIPADCEGRMGVTIPLKPGRSLLRLSGKGCWADNVVTLELGANFRKKTLFMDKITKEGINVFEERYMSFQSNISPSKDVYEMAGSVPCSATTTAYVFGMDGSHRFEDLLAPSCLIKSVSGNEVHSTTRENFVQYVGSMGFVYLTALDTVGEVTTEIKGDRATLRAHRRLSRQETKNKPIESFREWDEEIDFGLLNGQMIAAEIRRSNEKTLNLPKKGK